VSAVDDGRPFLDRPSLVFLGTSNAFFQDVAHASSESSRRMTAFARGANATFPEYTGAQSLAFCVPQLMPLGVSFMLTECGMEAKV